MSCCQKNPPQITQAYNRIQLMQSRKVRSLFRKHTKLIISPFLKSALFLSTFSKGKQLFCNKKQINEKIHRFHNSSTFSSYTYACINLPNSIAVSTNEKKAGSTNRLKPPVAWKRLQKWIGETLLSPSFDHLFSKKQSGSHWEVSNLNKPLAIGL